MKKFLVALLVIVIAFSFSFYLYNENLKAVGNDNTQIIQIEEGSNSNDIGLLLLENNLIKNLTAYKIYIKQNNLGNQLKAGEYVISDNMNLKEIVNLIIGGESIERTKNVTIPEGLSTVEISEIIQNNFNFSKEEFVESAEDIEYYRSDYEFLNDENIKSLEGFLFPDTYNFFTDSTPEQIIYNMLNRFDEIYKENIKDNLNDKNLYEVIIMASVVEGEAQIDSERPTVASVFYNRLDIDMKLQSCATVQYALGERKEKLYEEDLKIDSVYNTYMHVGLPAGPINSPGLQSIKAALNPEDTDYIYFVAKGDGSHYFTDNYEDFLDAKAKYID